MKTRKVGKLVAPLFGLLCVYNVHAAGGYDCSNMTNQVIKEAKSNHSKEVAIEYTPDMYPFAKICKASIIAANPSLVVETYKMEGKQMMQFSVSTN